MPSRDWQLEIGRYNKSIYHLQFPIGISLNCFQQFTFTPGRNWYLISIGQHQKTTLHNYIRLQQLRFVDQFDYQINVAEEIDPEEITIPPMFAQPIIENAIEHGIANSDYKCNLVISYQLDNGWIRLQVIDEGIGLTAQSNSHEHHSHAIRIIKERIVLINQQQNEQKASFSLNEGEKGSRQCFYRR